MSKDCFIFYLNPMAMNSQSFLRTVCKKTASSFFVLVWVLVTTICQMDGADKISQQQKETVTSINSKYDGEQDSTEESFILLNWETNFEEAKTRAALENKDIFIVFASTDTSVWGQRLDDEVLSNSFFGSVLSDSFIFLLLDFPMTYKFPEPEFQKNETIRKKWNVNTFPTVFLADSKGRPYAVTGYRNISAAEYAAHIRELRKIREIRDEKFSAFTATKNKEERARFLAQALRSIDESLLTLHYSKEIKELRNLDPKDLSGLISDVSFPLKISRLRGQVFQLVRAKKNYEEALATVDEFAKKNKLSGERLQKVLFLKLPVFANNEHRNHTAVVTLMDSIIKIDPTTESAKMAADVRKRALVLLSRESAKKTSPK